MPPIYHATETIREASERVQRYVNGETADVVYGVHWNYARHSLARDTEILARAYLSLGPLPTSLPAPTTDRQLSDAQEAIDWESDYPQCRNAAVMPTALPVEEEIDADWLRSICDNCLVGLWYEFRKGRLVITIHLTHDTKFATIEDEITQDEIELGDVHTRADVLRLLAALNITPHAERKGT